MRRWITLLAVMSLGLGTNAAAQENASGANPWLYEIRAGVLAHDVGGLWSGDRDERGFDLNAQLTFARGARRLAGNWVRPHLGATVNSRHFTSKLYGGGTWRIGGGDQAVFLDLGLGLAIHNGKRDTNRKDRKRLGSRILFHIPIELGYDFRGPHSLSLFFDHISNAGLSSNNEGMDTLGLRYGYAF